jgi:hypothetical protein
VQPQISRQLPVVVVLDMVSVALAVAEQLQVEQVAAGRHNLPVEEVLVLEMDFQEQMVMLI